MRVLIVDDESLIRMDLRDILESSGHEVLGEASNGVEALQLVPELRPDVILMDVKMPELDGIEAARQLSRESIAPVVLLTAFSQDDLVKKARESGVYGYLLKPIREENLVPALEMAIGRHEEDLHLRQQVETLAQDLEERKFVETATRIVMELYQISETEAYKRIRTLAMNKQMTVGSLAHQIIQSAKKKDKVKKSNFTY